MKLKLYIILVITLLSNIVRANAETITLPYMYVTNGENIYLSSGGGQITFDVTFTSTIQIGYEDIYVEQMNDYLDNKGGSDMIRVISLSVSGTVTVEVFPNTSTTDISFNISGTSGAKSVFVTLAGATPPPEPEPTEPKFNISGNWILGKTYTKSDGSNFQDITFYNSLGYPEQIINIGASSINKKNIVTPVTYDSLLRNDAKTYLPYVSANNTLASETNPTSLQQIFYTNLYGSSNGQYAYVEKVYEPSVLNRVLQEYNAGSVFRTQSKKSVYTYETNTSSEVFKFDVSSTNSLTVSYYSAGVLYKNSVTNEDGTVSYSFTDKSGRKVLDRTVGESSVNYNTYYAYDDFGRLAWVISPEGSSSLSTGTISTTSAIATKYSYIYTYDGHGNVIERRIPSKGVEYYVYDKGNRLVMSQDAQMRLSNDWVYYVYDNQNRLIDKSVIRGTLSRQDIQDKYNGTYFDNTYPLLGGSDNTHRPFDTQDFSVISVLESTRYEDNSYRTALTEQTYSLAMSGTYLKVYTDWIINWGAISLDLHNFYIHSGDYINDLYYICTDPNDPLVGYYYIPTAFTDIAQELTEVDPMGAYEIIYNYPGSAPEITSITIVSSIPPTSRILYTLDAGFSIPSSLSFSAITNVVSTSDNDASTIQGVKVYEKAGILGHNNTVTGYVERAYYYDYLGRVVQTAEKNHLGGISRVSTKYDLAGNILARHESHQPGSGLTADTKLTTYTYNGNNRGLIASETTTINGGTAGTVTYSYNELGQLTGKMYGNGASEALTYNIQGWLSNKSAARSGANLFNMTLRYYDATKGTSKFTGDITEWQWTQGSNPANIYSFSYDKLSRLTNSNLYVNDVAQNAFTEKNLTYDLNGNINQLQRYGSTSTLQDNFTYAYNGNTLTGITGSVSASYSYDGNGNMITDGRKNLQISYNMLNFQQSLSQRGTTVASYTYLADGTKCGVVGNANNGFDYLGSLIYSRSGSTRTFESASFGGGRIIYSGGTYSPYYYFTDHLGSTRVITNNSGTVVERNDYYPFGGKHANASYPQLTVNRQKFNGKELQTTGNTNFIDYGARMYDDVIGRWGVVDRFVEKYVGLTPYHYAANNPIKYIDVNGDSLSVAEKYREQLDKTLTTVFGNNAQNFSYTKTGMLVYSGTPKDFKGDTKEVYSQLSGTLSESTTTNVIYEESTQITLNDGTKTIVKASDGGGALAVLVGENNVSQNTVLISPYAKTEFTVFAITPAYYISPIDPSNGPRFNETKIQSNQTDLTFHELGHIINRGQSQDRVINFNNQVRKIMGLKPRPYDETHNRTIIQGNY